MAEKRFPDDYTEKVTIDDNDQYAVADSVLSDALSPIKHSTIKADIQDITSLDEKLSIAADDLYLINNSASSDAPNGVKHSTVSANVVATAQDIDSLTEKTSIVDDDTLMINDSGALGAVKKIKKSNLSPGIFADITALDSKATPVGADEIVINDSADLGKPKKILISNLPVTEQPYEFEGDTAGSAFVTLDTNTQTGNNSGTTTFKIKKPVMCYLELTVSLYNAGTPNGSLQIDQGGSTGRTMGAITATVTRSSNGTNSRYGIALMPGAYRIDNNNNPPGGTGATRVIKLIATGVFGGELSTASILE